MPPSGRGSERYEELPRVKRWRVCTIEHKRFWFEPEIIQPHLVGLESSLPHKPATGTRDICQLRRRYVPSMLDRSAPRPVVPCR
jgi:hypothetical protein